MKRFIIVIIISILLLGAGICEIILINNTYQKIETEINTLIEDYNANETDITPLYKDIDNLYNYWDNVEDSLCLLFNHRDLDTLSQSLEKVKEYTLQNDYDNAILELKLASGLVEKSKHIMAFNIFNIL